MISTTLDIDVFCRNIGTFRARDALDAIHFEVNELRVRCLADCGFPTPIEGTESWRYLTQLMAVRQYLNWANWADEATQRDQKVVPWLEAESVLKNAVLCRNDAEIMPTGCDMNDLYLVIDRYDIENCNVEQTMGVLQGLLANRDTVAFFRSRLTFGFYGYEEDPRTVYEIPEIREYLARLDDGFPYWYYFVSKERPWIELLYLSLCPYEKEPNGRMVLDPDANAAFKHRHGVAIDYLYGAFGLDPDDKQRLFAELSDLFSRISAP